MEQSKDKIQRFSKTMVNVSKVAKVFAILGIVGCAIGIIALGLVFFFLPEAIEYIKANPDTMGAIEIKFSNFRFVFISISEKSTLLQIVDDPTLFKNVISGGILDCVGGLISCIITLVLFNFIKNIFVKLEGAESLFSPTLFKDLKTSFIAITVLVLVNAGVIVALVVGLTLLVVYYLYLYGASLQKDVDETI